MLWQLLRYPSDDPHAQVFWRRRVSVLAVVGVVLLLMLVLLLKGGGGTDSVTPTAAVQPASGAPATAPGGPGPAGSAASTGATSSASATPTPSASPSASPSAAAVPTPTRDPATTCAPGSMALRIATDAPTYPAGVDPTLTLSVVDVGTQSCVVDLGTTATSISVLSAGKQVWSSSVCADKVARPVQLTPAAAQMLQLRWDRTRNVSACSSPGALPAGQYEIVARVGSAAVYGGSLVLS